MGVSRTVLAYKGRAALGSLAIFLVFATVLAFVTWRFWYPGYLFALDGGLQGLRIVLAVGFVLGPVLALVFFHPEKSRGKLVFDLVVVGAVQVGAMAWGLWQVWEQRPIGVVYGNQRFVTVAPDIMRRQHVAAADLARYSTATPPYVFRRAPLGTEEGKRAMVMLLRYSFHPESQAFLFEPFLPHLEEVFTRQEAMRRYVREQLPAGTWDTFAAGRADAGMAAYRLAFFEGRFGNAVLVFDPAGGYQGYLPLGERDLPILVDAPVAAAPGG